MKRKLKAGSTSITVVVFIPDVSSTTGAGLTGLTNATAGLTCYYRRDGASASVAVTLAAGTLGTWSSGGFKELDATNMRGQYELGIPDLALASGAKYVTLSLRGAANMPEVPVEIELDAVDYQDATAFGLSRVDAAITSRADSAQYTTARAAKLDNLDASILSRQPSGNVTVGAYAAGQDPATLLLVTPANKLDTDLTGRVNLGKWLGTVPAALSAVGAYVQTVLLRWLTDDAAGTPRALYAGPLGGLVAARPYMLIANQTAAGGGASTITFSAGSSVDDVYTGCIINLLSGASSGQQRLIVGYVGATKVATVSPAWIAAPDATTVFEVAAASEVDIGLWKRAVPNALASGRVDASVGAYPGNTAQTGDNFPRLGAPAGASVSADVAAVNAKTTNLPATPAAVGSAMALTSGERDSVADALLDRANAVEVGLTLRQAQRLIAAALAGKVSGAGTTTIVIRNAVADSKPRVTATVDSSGNRTLVVTDTS